jgi:CubicO group peptidase (beta-lactamase class C family)
MMSPGKYLHLVWLVAAGLFGVAPAYAAQLTVTEERSPARPPASAAAPFRWQTATPESQGMSGAKLDALRDVLAARQTKAFLVVRNDRIVYEWYAEGHGPAKTHYTASLAKAVVGGLSLAVDITDGRIALDDRAADFIPQWREDPRKSRITTAWDIRPGETCSFPTKWMSADGKRLHLVFSGGDQFCVRRATLTTSSMSH